MDIKLGKVMSYCKRLPPLKTRPLDYVANVTSSEYFKNLYLLDLWLLNPGVNLRE